MQLRKGERHYKPQLIDPSSSLRKGESPPSDIDSESQLALDDTLYDTNFDNTVYSDYHPESRRQLSDSVNDGSEYSTTQLGFSDIPELGHSDNPEKIKIEVCHIARQNEETSWESKVNNFYQFGLHVYDGLDFSSERDIIE
eukprot:UN29448